MHSFKADSGSEYVVNVTLSKAQGSLLIFSELSQLANASIISIYISTNIFNFQSNEISLKERLLKILFGFVFPLLLVTMGFFSDIYCFYGFWCLINREFSNSFGFAFYFIFWLTMIFNISLIADSYCKIKKAYVLNVDEQDQIRYEMSDYYALWL